MNIPDKAYEAAELAGEEAYVMGGVPEDVSKAAVRAAAPFIAAQALRDAAEKLPERGRVGWTKREAASYEKAIQESQELLLDLATELDPQ